MSATSVAYRARLLAVPFSKPVGSPHYRFTHLFTIMCEATQEGGRGLSGLWFAKVEQARVVLEALRYLAPVAGGLVNPADLLAALRREINFLGYKGVTVIATAGLEMALQDLVAREQERRPPRRNSVPAYWSGFFLTDSVESWVAEAETARSLGFTAFKARLGRPALEEDLERVSMLRAALGPGAVLMLDVNQAWDVATTLKAAGALQEHNVKWLEDPLVHNDYGGLRAVVQGSPIPIATGENEYMREGFQQLLEAGVTYLLADLQRVGGIGEWEAVASLAREQGAVLTPHLYPHVAVGLCARLDQDETWVEYVDWWDPLMSEHLVCRGGEFAAPAGAGLGFDADPTAIDRYALDGWEDLT